MKSRGENFVLFIIFYPGDLFDAPAECGENIGCKDVVDSHAKRNDALQSRTRVDRLLRERGQSSVGREGEPEDDGGPEAPGDLARPLRSRHGTSGGAKRMLGRLTRSRLSPGIQKRLWRLAVPCKRA